MSINPKAAWPWVKALLHSIYDQPDAESVRAQFDRVIHAFEAKLPAVAEQHDYWIEGRRYLGLDILTRSQAISTTDQEATDELTLQAPTA